MIVTGYEVTGPSVVIVASEQSGEIIVLAIVGLSGTIPNLIGELI